MPNSSYNVIHFEKPFSALLRRKSYVVMSKPFFVFPFLQSFAIVLWAKCVRKMVQRLASSLQITGWVSPSTINPWHKKFRFLTLHRLDHQMDRRRLKRAFFLDLASASTKTPCFAPHIFFEEKHHAQKFKLFSCSAVHKATLTLHQSRRMRRKFVNNMIAADI